MTDRGVSTVLDVSVCLLLVSAAVLTLVSVPASGPDPAAGRAEETATTLASTTATVTWSDGGTSRRTRGTLAGLLADATVSKRVSSKTEAFRAGVANATRGALGGDRWRGQVVATWRPYEDADPWSRVTVGRSPSGDTDVHAATMTIPSGIPPARSEARIGAARDGYRGVAAVLAGTVVDGANRSQRRYYVRRAVTDLERTFETPDAAARAVTVGRVHVTVRTWSP